MVYSGSLVLLYIKASEWLLVGGMRNTKLALSNQLIDSNNILNNSWRELQTSSGLKHISISAVGIFTDNQAHKIMRQYAFTAEFGEYKLCFPNGDNLIGKFQINHYERLGNFAEEECYNINLESAGEINYSNLQI